jgi:hypothetical protein
MIEDVDYLKAHSVRQSYIFLVDSADRDRATYPTPAEYVVDFTVPFRNVVGMEVLDASVPRTMYNVDTINDSVVFFIHTPDYDLGNIACVTRTIEHGEYTVQTLVPALNAIMSMHVNGDESQPVASIVVETSSNPPDVKNTLRFRCPYPFFLDMATSTMAETLGFDMHMQPAEAAVVAAKRRYDAVVPGMPKLYHSVHLPFEEGAALVPTKTVFEGPRGVLRMLELGKVAQRFRVETAGYLYQVFAALTAEAVATDQVAHWEVRKSSVIGAVLASGTIAVSFIDGTLSDSNTVAAWLDPGVYWLVLTSAVPLKVFYNDQLTTEGTTLLYYSGGAWLNKDIDGVYYQMCATVLMKDDYNMLTAPGIYTLVGPRYIVLRCPEIEENSFRSLAYSKHFLGLAKIRLGVVGYSENRLDFSNVPLREFHPIGKLTRLTLRFMLPSGELYDFKGVNHTITFAVHYYEPKQKEVFQRSIINPNYDGNFQAYMYKQEEQEADSDDAEDEDEYNRDDLLHTYRFHENKYLPQNMHIRNADMLREYEDELDYD